MLQQHRERLNSPHERGVYTSDEGVARGLMIEVEQGFARCLSRCVQLHRLLKHQPRVLAHRMEFDLWPVGLHRTQRGRVVDQ